MELTKSWWLHSIDAVLQYDFTNLRNSALLSARCIYLLIFKKICNQISLCSRLDRYSSHQNQGVWKCWFFIHKQPYSVWKWKTSLEKVAGIQGIVSACNKKASSTTDFYFFFFYLRQLYFAMYTESNSSYSEKSSSATYAHFFNTEKNRSSIEKLRLWTA